MGESGPAGGEVIRDASWVSREYGRDKWPAVLSKIKASIAAGERSLSRVLNDVIRSEWEAPDHRAITAVALGERVQLPAAVAWYGSYALIAEAVISACRGDTGAIVDLGCGWGRSLFEIWLRGGPDAATFHAFEFTAAGLDCVTTLAALEPQVKVRTARFDFEKPDFSPLARPLGHAVVFTVSSLHQVPLIDAGAYRMLLGIADTVDCLHFEQIGWQIEPCGPHAAADRDYALRNDYNRNLWNVLTELSGNREIDVVDVRADLFGTQAVYPMSLVHWRRPRR